MLKQSFMKRKNTVHPVIDKSLQWVPVLIEILSPPETHVIAQQTPVVMTDKFLESFELLLKGITAVRFFLVWILL
jgi:hypothetical protein